jgi:hypothetical protein
MNMRKVLLLILGLLIASPALYAQDVKIKVKKHSVKIKPKSPKYEQAAAPGENYVYVREDWTWDQGKSTWQWNGNRWVQVPAEGQHYVPGRWVRTEEGWEWQDGFWK